MIATTYKLSKWCFWMPFMCGIIIGLLLFGTSFMIFDQSIYTFEGIRTFCLVGPFLLYFIPSALLFRFIFKRTGKFGYSLLAYLLPLVIETIVYLYFIFGIFPSSILPLTDYRHFRGTPAYGIVRAIHFGYRFNTTDKESLNYQDSVTGMTPLIFAIKNGRYSDAENLVKSGADPNTTDLYTSISPLLEVCICSNGDSVISTEKIALVNTLLEHHADVNYKGHGYTPLMELCRNNVTNLSLYQLLISHGADVNAKFVQKDDYLHECYKENESPLNMAVYKGNYRVALFLLNHGADTISYREWMIETIEMNKETIMMPDQE